MKKLIVLFTLLLAFAVPAMAAGDLLVDDADILTSAEELRLSQKLEEASEACGMDVVIVTVDGIGGAYIRDYADDYYDYNIYADDGVLLLVDMDSYQWWITGTGDGVEIFTSTVINKIGNRVEGALGDGEYMAAFETYIDRCIYYVEDPFDVGGSLLVAVIVGLVAALIVTGIWRRQLKSVRPKASAVDYVKPGSLRLTGCQDLYLYSNVKRVRRENNHTSSSGRSHSGGGGRF